MARSIAAKGLKNPPAEPTDLDVKIIGVFKELPGASHQVIADRIGVSKATVSKRIRQWPDVDWYTRGRKMVKALAPQAVAAYQRRLEGVPVKMNCPKCGAQIAATEDTAAQHDILFGTGVLSQKHDHTVEFSIDSFRAWWGASDGDTRRAFIAELRAGGHAGRDDDNGNGSRS